ncbi:MAG: MFS transporter [Acidobacteriaceae bacterium]|nr:MFS transporter [Acidobacteriaceae bacterium]
MTTVETPSRPSTLQWVALVLLVISVAINYADRGNLGVAASAIERDLRLNPEKIGILSTGFFWTYALFQLVAGKLIDRWNVNWVYAAGFLLWSAATGLVGLVSSLSVMFMLRLLLGAGESIAYPSYSKIIATSFPEQLRGTANAAIDAGSKLGPAIGVMAGVEMMRFFGWRGMFVAIGAASLLWLLPWCITAAKLPSRRIQKASAWAPSYSELVTKRPVWGTVIGLFCGNYTWYFFLTWLPYYFERERHYHKQELAVMASLPFWAIAASSMLFGLLADFLIRQGYDPGRARQSFLCAGLTACCALTMAAVFTERLLTSNLLLILAAAALGAWSSNHWALSQYLAGPAGAGKWTAFQNCLGNFAGVVGAWLTGSVLTWTHSFFVAFTIACAILLVGVLGYWIVVGKPEQVHWEKRMDSDSSEQYSRKDSAKPIPPLASL